MKTQKLDVNSISVAVMLGKQGDYISLTDMAKTKTDAVRAADVIKNWLRSRVTLEFLGAWKLMYNPDFKVVEFDHFKQMAGLHTFTLSAKEWIEKIDFAHSTADEERINIIGRVADLLILFVVSTDRNGKVRIISARRAEKNEEEEYYGNYDIG